jgi:hypothetical protein
LRPGPPHPHSHPDRTSRSKRDERLHRHGRHVEPLETPPSCKRGEHENPFHPRKRLSNADAVAAAEWEVRKFRPCRLAIEEPSIGVESLRLRKEPRVVVQEVDRHEDRRAGRHVVAADLVVADRFALE